MTVNILKSHPDVRPPVYESTYEGCVLALRELNGYDDSDFVAVCWDETEGRVVNVTYATTRSWTYMNGATVDAPDELRVAVAERIAADVARHVPGIVAEVRAEVVKGATVRVVAGRKYLGREGRVFWVGEKTDRYSHRPEVRVGVDDGGDRFFLPASQVQVTVCPLPAHKVDAEVAHRVRRSLETALWNSGCGVTADRVMHLVDGSVPV